MNTYTQTAFSDKLEAVKTLEKLLDGVFWSVEETRVS